MSYAVVYHPTVIRDDIPSLDQATRRRIKSAIEDKLFERPELFGIPLRQSLKGHRKLRVGDYRVVFRIMEREVYIIAVSHRSTAYQESARRI